MSDTDYTADIARFTSPVDPAAVKTIVKYCGIALHSRDASTVSGTDPKELATVRDGFAAKKLGLTAEQADAGIAQVLAKMKGERSKHRVTFYYLLAESTGTMARLTG